MKKLTTRHGFTVGALAGMALGLVGAKAQSLSYQVTTGPGLWGGPGFNLTHPGGSSGPVAAGMFALQPQSGNPAGFNVLVNSFCTDVGVQINTGTVYAFDHVSFGALQTDNLPPWAAGGEAIYNAAFLYYSFKDGVLGATTQQNEMAAGLQLAIWETLYDRSAKGNFTDATLELGSGSFKATGDATALGFAEAYLDQAAAAPWHQFPGFWLDNEFGNPNNAQGMLTPQDPSGNFVPVPEPATWVGGGLLCLLVIGLRHRQARAQQAIC